MPTFQPAALGDIRRNAHVPQILAIRAKVRAGERLQPAPLAVMAARAHRLMKGTLVTGRLGEAGDVRRRILLMQDDLPAVPCELQRPRESTNQIKAGAVSVRMRNRSSEATSAFLCCWRSNKSAACRASNERNRISRSPP